MANINELVSIIGETQHYFKLQASRQVDTALTLRNWLFGYYIAEYELNGADRAEYGQKIFKEIAKRLEKQGFRQIRERHLYLCKDFYMAYQNILRTVSAKLISITDGSIESDRLPKFENFQSPTGNFQIDVEKLINQLNFNNYKRQIKEKELH